MTPSTRRILIAAAVIAAAFLTGFMMQCGRARNLNRSLETARAELYGLLAQLYYAPPGAELLAALRVAVTDAPQQGAFLEEPWRALVGVARAMADRDIAAEYDALFGGVGKPEVYLFASHYLSGYLNEKPLA